MNNMDLYQKLAPVPQDAKKPIGAGRLKGMTDINPQWRIERLTEVFGPCGIGWVPTITKQWMENGADGTICAFCNIDLKIKDPETGAWSEPISGTGGSSFVAKEKAGFYTSDECYKMAYTDAISVAAKLIGVGADVYRGYSDSKYYKPVEQTKQPDMDYTKEVTPAQYKKVAQEENALATNDQMKMMFDLFDPEEIENICNTFGVETTRKLTFKDAQRCINKRLKQLDAQEAANAG